MFVKPVVQVRQPRLLVAEGCVETYWPRLQVAQAEHEGEFCRLEKVPAVQLVHVRSADVDPAKLTELPRGQFVMARQVVVFTAVEYVFAPQLEQARSAMLVPEVLMN